MNITIKREVLHPILQSVTKVIEDKSSAAAIFSHVLLEAEEASLCLTGAGPEVEISGEVNCTVTEKGRITVPARKLSVICQHMEDGKALDLALHEKQAGIRTGENEYFLNTLPAEDFPIPEEEDLQYEYRIRQADFRDLLDRTRNCMAQDDVRQYLNGMLLEFRGRFLRGVATDSHRLALCNISVLSGGPVEKEEGTAKPETAESGDPVDEPVDSDDAGVKEVVKSDEIEVSLIVPRRGVEELARLVSGNGTALLKIMQGKLRVSLEEQKICFGTRLIEGRYPDYSRVIPEPGEQELIVECKLLKGVLSQVISFIQDRNPCVRLTLGTKQLQVHASSPENERLHLKIPCAFSAEQMEISFNAQYLSKVLDNVNTSKARFCFNGTESSCLILPFVETKDVEESKSEGIDQDEERTEDKILPGDYKFVVMPMRV